MPKSTGCKFKFGKFWQKLKGKSHWLQPSQSTSANRSSRNPTAPLEKRKGGRKRSYKWGSEGKLRAVQREFPSPISAVTWRAPSLSTVSNFIASEAHNNRTVPSSVGGCGAHNNCERAGDEDVIGCEIAQYHTHTTHPYQRIPTHTTVFEIGSNIIHHPPPPILLIRDCTTPQKSIPLTLKRNHEFHRFLQPIHVSIYYELTMQPIQPCT